MAKRVPTGKPRGFAKGGAAYVGPAKGAGHGGEAKGAGFGGPAEPLNRRFTSDVQPDPEISADRAASKADMIAYLSAKRMSFAKAVVSIAENGSHPQQLAAAIAGMNRLDGSPTQGAPGGDGEQKTSHTFTWGDGST